MIENSMAIKSNDSNKVNEGKCRKGMKREENHSKIEKFTD